eukprot:comp22243_c0_seq1/m.52767 comp22243_c0_seq1/g.52767  ORF comp22243_c0_seq1/g.52767 comp22243_c0_seq1/m.52767 type:complete len:478 (+) comp22243_c0_seq1:1903-3336(+)
MREHKHLGQRECGCNHNAVAEMARCACAKGDEAPDARIKRQRRQELAESRDGGEVERMVLVADGVDVVLETLVELDALLLRELGKLFLHGLRDPERTCLHELLDSGAQRVVLWGLEGFLECLFRMAEERVLFDGFCEHLEAQHRGDQALAQHFWDLVRDQALVKVLWIHAEDSAREQASAAAHALESGCARDPHCGEPGQALLGVVVQLAHHAKVDHIAHRWDGHTALGDVCGQHDTGHSGGDRIECTELLLVVDCGVEHNDLDILVAELATVLALGAVVAIQVLTLVVVVVVAGSGSGAVLGGKVGHGDHLDEELVHFVDLGQSGKEDQDAVAARVVAVMLRKCAAHKHGQGVEIVLGLGLQIGLAHRVLAVEHLCDAGEIVCLVGHVVRAEDAVAGEVFQVDDLDRVALDADKEIGDAAEMGLVVADVECLVHGRGEVVDKKIGVECGGHEHDLCGADGGREQLLDEQVEQIAVD